MPTAQATAAPVLGTDWSAPVIVQDRMVAGRIWDMAATTDRVVAVGQTVDAGRTTARVWTSSDGLTWSVAESDPSFTGAEMFSVAAGGPGFVAVGFAVGLADGPDTPPTRGGERVWTSPDGVTWTPAEVRDAGMGRLEAVAAGPTGLVAVGNEPTDDPQCPRATAWTSADGRSWSKAPANADETCAGWFAVAAAGPLFIATGRRREEGAAAWTSTDGRSWDRVSSFAPGGTSSFEVIASADLALALVAYPPGDTGSGLGVRVSADGRTWRDATADRLMPGAPIGTTAIARSTEGYVLLSDTTGTWASSDGASWTLTDASPVSDFGLFGLRATGFGADVVAIGGRSGRLAAIVTPRFAEPVAAPQPPAVRSVVLPVTDGTAAARSVAVGADGLLVAVGFERPPDFRDRNAVWTSQDGAAWSAPAPQLGWGSMNAVAAYEAGFVAVGEVRAIPPGTEGSLPTTTIWITESEGLSWAALSLDEELGIADGRLVDVAATDSRVVAAIQGGRAACTLPGEPTSTIIESLDGRHWTVVDDPDVACGQIWGLAARGALIVAVGAGFVQASVDGMSPVRGTPVPAVWVSADGRDWVAVPGPDAPSFGFDDIAIGPRGIVATAVAGGGDPMVSFYASADGRTWTESDYRTPFQRRGEIATAVAAGDGGYLAVGGIMGGTGFVGPAVWWSTDGRHWDRVLGEVPPEQPGEGPRPGVGLLDVAAYGDLFVALASDGTAWLITPP